MDGQTSAWKVLLCTISFWNCHIVVENDERGSLEKYDIKIGYSHTGMLDFCKYLYNDISSDVDEWASFTNEEEEDIEEKKRELLQKLKRLKSLISEKEAFFNDRRCVFL